MKKIHVLFMAMKETDDEQTYCDGRQQETTKTEGDILNFKDTNLESRSYISLNRVFRDKIKFTS